MKNVVISIISGLLLLTACTTTKPVPVVTNVQNRIEIPPHPTPLSLNDVHWVVLNEHGLLDILVARNLITPADEQKILANRPPNAPNDDYVLFALTTQDFQNLAINIKDIQKFLEQQNVVIQQFIDATEPSRQPQNLPYTTIKK